MHPNKIINEDLENICSSDIDWSRFNQKTILITGANGFLPAYMVETLLYIKAKCLVVDLKVIALVRNKSKADHKFAHHIGNSSLEFLVQDVSAPIQIEQKVDYIVHAASQASPKYYGTDPVGTLKANTLGTLNVLELAREKNIESMLNFSSGEVYGVTKTDIGGISELDYGYMDITNVRSCYGESKRMSENMCVSYHHQYGVPVKSVRPFHTYGPGMMLDDGRVFADFVGNIVRGEDIVMHSDGSAVRAFCYLTDAVKGFFAILLKGANGESYNLGNPMQAVSIKYLAETLVRLYPEKGLKVITEQGKQNYLQSPIPINSPSVDRLEQLGWSPTTNIEVGFRQTIDSYLQQ